MNDDGVPETYTTKRWRNGILRISMGREWRCSEVSFWSGGSGKSRELIYEGSSVQWEILWSLVSILRNKQNTNQDITDLGGPDIRGTPVSVTEKRRIVY